MENKIRYNHLNEYLKNKFGERTLKICIDGGFTCPNRDGTLSKNGCIFCSGKGSGEHINSSQNIEDQIRNYFESYKATRANKFLAYFQNFTNTYDTIENLRNKYNSALIDKRIVGLSIATRPDCINEDIVKLLKSYTDKYYVSVELGLQTSNEETGNLINRKYTNKDFSVAVALLNKYNIDVITHIMVGLPNETFEDIQNTVNFINNQMKNNSFNECQYKKVSYEECQLAESEFINTSLATLDFSSCDIQQIIVPVENLRGLTVSSEQAVALASLLGLKIV